MMKYTIPDFTALMLVLPTTLLAACSPVSGQDDAASGQAKQFTAALPKEQLGRGVLLLDNWNEWGEGHYLDAVRKVFGTAPEQHLDLLPEDIVRGPYDAATRAHFEVLEEKERLARKRVVKAGAPAGLVAWWTFDDPADSPVALDYCGHRNGGFRKKARRTAGFYDEDATIPHCRLAGRIGVDDPSLCFRALGAADRSLGGRPAVESNPKESP